MCCIRGQMCLRVRQVTCHYELSMACKSDLKKKELNDVACNVNVAYVKGMLRYQQCYKSEGKSAQLSFYS